jgi:hypothetical protein
LQTPSGTPFADSINVPVRVRITQPPKEKELDGLSLDRFYPGTVRDVSAPLAAWLIAQGYAEPEMRRGEPDDLGVRGESIKSARVTSDDRPRRRSTDR